MCEKKSTQELYDPARSVCSSYMDFFEKESLLNIVYYLSTFLVSPSSFFFGFEFQILFCLQIEELEVGPSTSYLGSFISYS